MGKCKEKSAVLAKICMDLKDFGVICGSRGILVPKIVVRGGWEYLEIGQQNSEKWSCPGDYNSAWESKNPIYENY